MRTAANEIRYALRRLASAPAFTLITLLTLAIGIGANTAIFSVIHGVLLAPLPYPQPDRLVSIRQTAPGIGLNQPLEISASNYFVFGDQSRTLQQVGLWSPGTAGITGIGDPEQVQVVNVTHEILEELGVPPARGRRFTARDDQPGSAEVVLLTDSYWQRRFGADPTAVGRRILVNGRAREIVGILPPRFRFLDRKPDLLLPLRFERAKTLLGNFSYQSIARLQPNATLAQANTEVGRLILLTSQLFPAPPGFSVKMFEQARLQPRVRPLAEDITGEISQALWVVMATVAIVLLIACANVANLLLARVEGRRHEFAIRAALGAGWGRIARDLLLESVLLGLAGGLLGLGMAQAALRLLIARGPAELPRLDNISIDPAVLLFALAVSLGSGILFGALPVIRYAGPRIVQTLRGGARGMTHSRDRHRTRNTLIVVQVALALILLIAAGLMIRSFAALRQVRPGFSNAAQIQTFSLYVPEARVRDPEQALRVLQNILARIEQIPGVAAASFASSIPTDGFNSNDPIYAQDRTYRDGELAPIRRFKFIAPGFAGTVGAPLLAGRDITWTEVYDRRPVVLVTENLARDLWRDPASAVGKHVRENPRSPWREVVGVIGNIHDDGAARKAPAIVYWPMLIKDYWGNPTFLQRRAVYVIRSGRAGSEDFLRDLRQAVWAVDSSLPLANVRSLEEAYRGSMARTSFTLVMLAIAGAMALLLGLVGIYGAVSYTVSQRTREIGIRAALGAQPRALRRMFVRDALLLAGCGVACGLAVAFPLTRLMSSLLFEVKAADPLTYAAVAAGLVAAAIAASYLPARRASAVDPLQALRAE